jgi:hypothetical protein
MSADEDGADRAARWSAELTAAINAKLVIGQRYLGAVDGGGVVEIVFDDPPGTRYNLLSIDPRHGILLGSVADPDGYASGDAEWPRR